ncbi:hypothetical protein C1933_19220 [Stenotrophomonas sp. ZAC14D2_NAIMI4_6]|nr:hypothetical protein C1933_19220 [Stenotrophomonas sp. ZAC14D2_NAIMI4_6]
MTDGRMAGWPDGRMAGIVESSLLDCFCQQQSSKLDSTAQGRLVRHRGAMSVRSTSRRMIDAFDITA